MHFNPLNEHLPEPPIIPTVNLKVKSKFYGHRTLSAGVYATTGLSKLVAIQWTSAAYCYRAALMETCCASLDIVRLFMVRSGSRENHDMEETTLTKDQKDTSGIRPNSKHGGL